MRNLTHRGVYVPHYSPIGLKIKYKGKEIILDPECELMALHFTKKLDTKYVEDKVFVSNFLNDFAAKLCLVSDSDIKVHDLLEEIKLEDFDFSSIKEYLVEVQKKKDAMNKEERKLAIKLQKELRTGMKAKYGYASVDGINTPIMNWASEPSSIFLSKGTNKLRGHWKEGPKREEITLNLSAKPEGLEEGWKEIVFEGDKMWIAKWIDRLTGKEKYVWLSPNSSIRQEREKKKFLLASELEKELHKLEKYIDKELKSPDIEARKLATIVYLIKETGIRVGDEDLKGETENVGCTTLEGKHLRFENNKVILDFRGKDFVQWLRTLEVPAQVFKNLKKFKGKDNELLFPNTDSNKVTKFLRKAIPGISAKIFRTYLAGVIWDKYSSENLKLINKDTSLPVKKCLFKLINLEVAKKLNHKKALPKNYLERLAKKKEQLRKEQVKLNTLKEINSKRYIAQRLKVEKIACDYKILDETAEWNLSTSLASYISPVKVVSFCKKSNLELKDVYSKNLLEKFSWVES